MKLLAPNQAWSSVRERSEKDERRAIDLQQLVKDKHTELVEAEQVFSDTLHRNQAQWQKEESEHQTKLQILVKAVKDIEERREAAFFPLVEKEKNLNTMSSALGQKEEELSRKERELNEQADLLKDKLDTVSEREIRVEERENGVKIKERGLQEQSEHLKVVSEGFTESMLKAEQEYKQKSNVIAVERASLYTKETHLQERERLIELKDSDLIRREIKLKDERFALEEAVKEVNKLK